MKSSFSLPWDNWCWKTELYTVLLSEISVLAWWFLFAKLLWVISKGSRKNSMNQYLCYGPALPHCSYWARTWVPYVESLLHWKFPSKRKLPGSVFQLRQLAWQVVRYGKWCALFGVWWAGGTWSERVHFAVSTFSPNVVPKELHVLAQHNSRWFGESRKCSLKYSAGFLRSKINQILLYLDMQI